MVGLLASLLACGGGDADQGGSGAGQCESSCNRLRACNVGSDFCAPGICATTAERWRPDLSSAYFGCLLDPATPCVSASVESCLSTAASSIQPRQSETDYMNACLQKRKACADSYADDYCLGARVLSDAWLARAGACLDKACAEAGACLRPLFQ